MDSENKNEAINLSNEITSQEQESNEVTLGGVENTVTPSIPEADPALVETTPAETPSASGTATVIDQNGSAIMTYTKEVHGDGFRELAEKLAAKKGATVI